MIKPKILIVDDQADIRLLLGEFLKDEGYEVIVASDSHEAFCLLDYEKPDIVLLDIWLNDKRFDGIAILDVIREKFPDVVTIMMSGHGNIETAVESLKKGAFDFIEKPFKTERLATMLKNACQVVDLRRQIAILREKTSEQANFIGSSKLYESLRQELNKLAPTNTRVLIMGEAGVGKTSAARYLHKKSLRANEPLIEVNCAVLDAEQFSELFFGLESRSVEGFPIIKVGLLEKAHRGTMILENIQDLPKVVQSKLAHVLHSKKFQRVGGEVAYEIDVRFLTTLTLSKVENAVSRIREDLYHRLAVAKIDIPALRRHPEDIPELIKLFYQHLNPKKPSVFLSQESKFILLNYHWPGNVRQLRNIVEWFSILLGDSDSQLLPKHLPNELQNPGEVGQDSYDFFTGPLKDARDKFEKAYISFHLRCCDGSIKKTAEQIEMDRTALHRKMKGLGLVAQD